MDRWLKKRSHLKMEEGIMIGIFQHFLTFYGRNY